MKLETVEKALNSCLNGSTPSATKQEILDQMSDLLMVLTQFQDKWDINVCSEKKDTKRSSVTQLRLVTFFSEQTLYRLDVD